MDFDPAGLDNASRRPRLARLLLPAEDILDAAARHFDQAHLYADQITQWARALDSDSREILKAPWRHMQRMRRGLAQEHMDSLTR
jgi:hypothetical protein